MCICTCVYKCTYADIFYVYMNTYMYTYIHMYVTYIYIYICTHIFTVCMYTTCQVVGPWALRKPLVFEAASTGAPRASQPEWAARLAQLWANFQSLLTPAGCFAVGFGTSLESNLQFCWLYIHVFMWVSTYRSTQTMDIHTRVYIRMCKMVLAGFQEQLRFVG